METETENKALQKDFFLEKLLGSVALLQTLKKRKLEDVEEIDTFIESLIKEMEEKEKEDSKKAQGDTHSKESSTQEQDLMEDGVSPAKKEEGTVEQQEVPSEYPISMTAKSLKDLAQKMATLTTKTIAGKIIVDMSGGDISMKNAGEPVNDDGGAKPDVEVIGQTRVFCPVCDEYHDKPH